MFLKKQDLYLKIRPNDLEQIIGQNDDVINHSLNYSECIMRSYLSAYNLENLFGAEDRDTLLISFGVDIAIYEIIAISRPNISLTDKRERKQDAIKYLEEIRDKKIVTTWVSK
ncbi:MAG: DUF1320 family protein [Bacteroidetes bacterium]|nr:DUF1320 family protein [Bacteroidota bacterium]